VRAAAIPVDPGQRTHGAEHGRELDGPVAAARKVGALVLAGWQSAASYRLNMVLSLASLVVALVPVFFIARALDPLMAESVASQGGDYFAFLLLGMIVFSLLMSAVHTLPGALRGGIGNGTFEAMLATPTAVPVLLTGLMGYGVLWTGLRSLLLLLGGVALGMPLAVHQLLPALLIVGLLLLAYSAFGLMAAASILAFRTAGPIPNIVLVVSALLGGVYYPTQVIPTWIQSLSDVVPLTYGLRALRRTLLEGVPLHAVAGDVAILAAFAAVLLAAGGWAFARALRYSRRNGTLAHY
jgi:ABC-2 type transport system permease protein